MNQRVFIAKEATIASFGFFSLPYLRIGVSISLSRKIYGGKVTESIHL